MPLQCLGIGSKFPGQHTSEQSTVSLIDCLRIETPTVAGRLWYALHTSHVSSSVTAALPHSLTATCHLHCHAHVTRRAVAGPAGAKVVVAQSFARIFFRNCVATCGPSDWLGSGRVRVMTLPVMECRVSITTQALHHACTGSDQPVSPRRLDMHGVVDKTHSS